MPMAAVESVMTLSDHLRPRSFATLWSPKVCELPFAIPLSSALPEDNANHSLRSTTSLDDAGATKCGPTARGRQSPCRHRRSVPLRDLGSQISKRVVAGPASTGLPSLVLHLTALLVLRTQGTAPWLRRQCQGGRAPNRCVWLKVR